MESASLYWELFVKTGAPEAWLAYRSQTEQKKEETTQTG